MKYHHSRCSKQDSNPEFDTGMAEVVQSHGHTYSLRRRQFGNDGH